MVYNEFQVKGSNIFLESYHTLPFVMSLFSISLTVPSQMPNPVVITMVSLTSIPSFPFILSVSIQVPLKVACTLKGLTEEHWIKGLFTEVWEIMKLPGNYNSWKPSPRGGLGGAVWGSCVTETQRELGERGHLIENMASSRRKAATGNTMSQRCGGFAVRNKYPSIFFHLLSNLLLLSPSGWAQLEARCKEVHVTSPQSS